MSAGTLARRVTFPVAADKHKSRLLDATGRALFDVCALELDEGWKASAETAEAVLHLAVTLLNAAHRVDPANPEAGGEMITSFSEQSTVVSLEDAQKEYADRLQYTAYAERLQKLSRGKV